MTYADPIGSVLQRDFDLGMVGRIDAVEMIVTKGGEEYPQYTVGLNGVDGPKLYGGSCPVVFKNPEDVIQDFLLPCFTMMPMDFEIDETRLVGDMSKGYRVPAPDAVIVGTTHGRDIYDKYEQRYRPWPATYSYEVGCEARSRREARLMRFHLLRCFPRNLAWINVIDSKGDTRTYTVHVDNNVSDNSEISGVTERKIVYTLPVRVEGEIDLMDRINADAAYGGGLLADRRVFDMSDLSV